MRLIVCALLSEAICIVEKYSLELVQKNPRIYKNTDILLLICGVGKINIEQNLPNIFLQYNITKAINIGIAGISDKSIPIGELFCTNHQLQSIKYYNLTTVDTPCVGKGIKDSLYDMEGSYFYAISKKHLLDKNIFIFKVVSDYLDNTIPKKDFIKQLISKHIDKILTTD